MTACDSKRQHYPFSPTTDHYSFNHQSQLQHYQSPQPYRATSVTPSYSDLSQLSTHTYTSPSVFALNGKIKSNKRLANIQVRKPVSHHSIDLSGFASPLSDSSPLMLNYEFSTTPRHFQHPSLTPTSNTFGVQAGSPVFPHLWDTTTGAMAMNSPAMHASPMNRGVKRPHQRTASNSSSIASSTGMTASNTYPYGAGSSPVTGTASKLSQQYPIDGSRTFAHNLPTPTQTPTQDSFLSSQQQQQQHHFNGSQHHDQAAMASLMLSRAMDHHAGVEDDVPGMSHSGRHSVSSMGQEPTTPHTVVDGFDGDFRIPTHDSSHTIPQFSRTISDMKHTIPKFDRTMSDIYQDELYDPSTATMSTYKSTPSTYLAPFRNTKITEALHAAQIARSQSPNSQVSGGISPFRPDSPYVQDNRRMRTAAQIRAEQKAQAVKNELDQHMASPQNHLPQATISPKDALLDYRSDDHDSAAAMAPLFPQSFDQQLQAQYVQSLASNDRNGIWGSSNAQTSQESQRQQQVSQSYNLSAPSFSAADPFQGVKQDHTPEFPATLTSMESSASEAPASSQSSLPSVQNMSIGSSIAPSQPSPTFAKRPANGATLADSGAFTCTYQSCSARFPTQHKLQKHKRESHRPSTILPNQAQQHTPGVGSGMSSAALLVRNSQQGPHRCDRINPTTGKSCNTIFSRPYDLTRHEDTIHNIRKQKVRCALCVEEKTFSRNDALTRHMRVVHPEVDFPGKHKRRDSEE